jgi:hypothetical protein
MVLVCVALELARIHVPKLLQAGGRALALLVSKAHEQRVAAIRLEAGEARDVLVIRRTKVPVTIPVSVSIPVSIAVSVSITVSITVSVPVSIAIPIAISVAARRLAHVVLVALEVILALAFFVAGAVLGAVDTVRVEADTVGAHQVAVTAHVVLAGTTCGAVDASPAIRITVAIPVAVAVAIPVVIAVPSARAPGPTRVLVVEAGDAECEEQASN